MVNAFLAVAHFAGRRPGVYLSCCLAIGFAARLAMAHGDMRLFINPLFPLFIR